MAIKINFDSDNKPMQPMIVLATRSGKLLGALPAVNINVKSGIDNRILYSEMSFNVYKNSVGSKIWDKIKNFKLVWVKEWNCLFEIEVETFESDTEIRKFITATSLGKAELSRIKLYDTQINTESDIARDDYVPTTFYNPTNTSASLLHRITEKAPHYHNFEITDKDDGGISTLSAIQRTFSFDDQDIYTTLSEIAEDVNCVFEIECYLDSDGTVIKRRIKTYDSDLFGVETPVFISVENLAQDITYKKESDSVANCYRLKSGDDLMDAAIISCNPNGTAYIWNFTDEDREDMSKALVDKLTAYNSLYDGYKTGEDLPTADGGKRNYTMFSELITKYNDNALMLVLIKLGIATGFQEANEVRTKYKGMASIVSPPEISEYPILTSVDDLTSEAMNSNYPGLIARLYDTIEYSIYLNHNLMPSTTASDESTAEDEAAKISNQLDGATVAVKDLSKASKWSVADSVIKFAKTIIDSTRYSVQVSGESTYENNKWSGNLTVSRKSGNEISGNVNVTVVVNEDMETFVKQQIDIELSKAEDPTGIVALFKKSSDDFKAELKKYGLTRLKAFQDCAYGCMDVIDQKSDATWANATKDIRVDLNTKLNALSDETEIRESEYNTFFAIYTMLLQEIQLIHEKLNFEDYLGTDLWQELSSYRRESSYSNSNYISDGLTDAEILYNADEFYSAAEKEITDIHDSGNTITSSIYNLLAMKEFEPIVDYFVLGNRIKCKSDGKLFSLKLNEYEIDYDNLESFNVSFSDTLAISGYSDILKNSSSMMTLKKFVKRVVGVIDNIGSIFKTFETIGGKSL